MLFRIEPLDDGTWFVELQPKDGRIEVGTGVIDSVRRSSIINLESWEARALAGALSALASALESAPEE